MENTDTQAPELYTQEELDALEAHIQTYFGAFDQVLHEIVSPDIHVDIAHILPGKERDYHVMVTMGMGAHRMKTPPELADKQLDRAELLICLPPDWELENQDERWYWPLRWLKVLARLPGNQDTWLGWGHSVPSDGPFAQGTDLCGMLLVDPGAFPQEASRCQMPDGSVVNFYQLIPLYREELDLKVEKGAESLLERMEDALLEVVRPDRRNSCGFVPQKNFYPIEGGVKELLQWEGAAGCLATDRITVDGCKVGYMYREEPESEMPDSGWRFTAGDESSAYMDQAENSGIYHLNTICNYDPDILPLLDAPYGTAYYRDEKGVFQKEAYKPQEEDSTPPHNHTNEE